MFERISDSPENVSKALMTTTPDKQGESEHHEGDNGSKL